MKRRGGYEILIIIYFAIFLAALILNINPREVGLGMDDGVYVCLAKALAEGRGYINIFDVDNTPHALYFPFYPFLLSLVWKIYPYFPLNIILMKLISISAFCVLMYCSFMFFKRILSLNESRVYSVAAVLLISCVSVYQYGNKVNSDILYTALQFLSFYFVYKIKNKKENSPLFLMTVVVSSCLLFYLRPVGITFCCGWLAYFLLRGKIKFLFTYGIAVFSIGLPWLIYIFRVRNSSYIGLLGSGRYSTTLTTIFPIVFNNLKGIAFSSIPSYIFPTIFSKFVVTHFSGYYFIFMRMVLCLIISAIVLYGFISLFRKDIFIVYYSACYLALILVWNWEPTRFLLPFAPLFMVSFFYGILKLADMLKVIFFEKYRAMFTHMLFLIIFLTILTGNLVRAADLFDYQNFLSLRNSSHPHQPIFNWIRYNTRKEDILATPFPAMYYLYTERRGMSYLADFSEENRETISEQLIRRLDATDTTYVIKTHFESYPFSLDVGYGIVDAARQYYASFFEEVFRDNRTGLIAYKFNK